MNILTVLLSFFHLNLVCGGDPICCIYKWMHSLLQCGDNSSATRRRCLRILVVAHTKEMSQWLSQSNLNPFLILIAASLRSSDISSSQMLVMKFCICDCFWLWPNFRSAGIPFAPHIKRNQAQVTFILQSEVWDLEISESSWTIPTVTDPKTPLLSKYSKSELLHQHYQVVWGTLNVRLSV